MITNRPIIRELIPPIVSFSSVAILGIAGYMYLGEVGLIEAMFWLVDPTSIELHGAGDEVKAFSILVIVGLVVTGIWIAESVLSAAFGGQIQSELKYMQIENRINKLDDHVVICGYGMFGRTIAHGVDEGSEDVVIIEYDEHQYERALDDGHLAIHGDARREGVLEDAGVARASAVITAVDNSNTNIQIAIQVGQLAEDVTLVVRVGDEMYTSMAKRAGADEVVIPEVFSGEDVVLEFL